MGPFYWNTVYIFIQLGRVLFAPFPVFVRKVVLILVLVIMHERTTMFVFAHENNIAI